MGTGWVRRRRGGIVCGIGRGLMLVALLLAAAPVVHAEETSPQTAVAHTGTLIGRTSAQQPVTIAVPLKVGDPAALESFLRDLYDPASPQYHKYLTPADFTKRFVDGKARAQVADYLRGQGLTVTDSGLGTVVTATGSAAQMERAFAVTLSDYRDADGKVYYGNDRTAALPASVAARVQGVLGLDSAQSDVPHFVKPPLDQPPARTSDEPRSPSGCTAAVTVANRYGSFTPNQISGAYNFDYFQTNLVRGDGQTVALFELDDYQDSNVAAYQSCFGTAVPLTRVPVNGGATIGQSGGEGEVELDIDVIVGMAPRLAQLLVYESPNTIANVTNQYQRIANDNLAQVVSTSWGNCEPNRTNTSLNAFNAIFQQFAAQGISIFAAGGDDGSTDCTNAPLRNSLTVDDPASQPYVTGVGGTTLTINASNQYTSERVWNRYTQGGGAGGGGTSVYWNRPTYQTGPGIAYGGREVPDITANGDPYTGYTVYVRDTSGCPTVTGVAGTTDCFEPIGGTSAAAPLWAAATALMNQFLSITGATRIGFANPQLYSLLPNVTAPSAIRPFPFHDITAGDNCYRPASGCGTPNSGSGIFLATFAYDPVSGIGSFNAGNLVSVLFAPVVASISRSAGPVTGNTPIVIGGTGFQSGATVSFDGVPGTNVNVLSATSLNVTTPAHAVGIVSIVVTNPSGRPCTLANAFEYFVLSVASVSPNTGPTSGGAAITITGTHFSSGASVLVGGVAATSVVVVNDTTITCVTPASNATYAEVAVNTADGLVARAPGAFRYVERYAPSVPGSPGTEPSGRSGGGSGQPQPVPPSR